MTEAGMEASSGSSQMPSRVQRLSALTVWLFAAVGFLASVVTVAGYFSSDRSQLQVRLTPQAALVQSTILDAVAEDDDEPGFVRDTAQRNKDFFCKGADQLKVKKDESLPAIAEECRNFVRLEAVTDLLKLYDSDTLASLDYQIVNTGSSIAEEIKLGSKGVISVDIIDERGTRSRVQAKKGESFFRLPNLNPKEKVRVVAWVTNSTFLYNKSYLERDDFPSITFKGRSVGITIMLATPQAYFELHEVLTSMPTALAAFFFIALCMVVTLVLILTVNVIAALVQGRPLKTVFANSSAEAADGKSAEAG